MMSQPEVSALIDDLLAVDEAQRSEAFAKLIDAEPAALPALADALGIALFAPEAEDEVSVDFQHIPLNEALAMHVLPVCWHDRHWLLLSDPFSLALRQWAQRLPVTLAIASPGWLREQLEALTRQQRTLDQLEQQGNEEGEDEVILEITPGNIASESNPIIKLVNATLYDAIQSRASDIHLSAAPDGLAVKYRVDGVIHAIRHCPGIQASGQIISRIKVLSSMDISERRIPQDGRFKAMIHQRPVDFRVSVVPGIHGEDAVLRVLDKSHSSTLSLETLGFDDHTLREIRLLTHQPHGMVLVTGPTGSGKSTTLYAALSELNTGDNKIITIEDPVEYQLNDVLQIPVNDKKGLTFARGLRAILRQRSRHHSGRRDPRQRNRRHRRAGCAHRPPGALLRPRQRCLQRAGAFPLYERRCQQPALRAARRAGAAAGARHLPAVPGGGATERTGSSPVAAELAPYTHACVA